MLFLKYYRERIEALKKLVESNQQNNLIEYIPESLHSIGNENMITSNSVENNSKRIDFKENKDKDSENSKEDAGLLE